MTVNVSRSFLLSFLIHPLCFSGGVVMQEKLILNEEKTVSRAEARRYSRHLALPDSSLARS